MSLPLTACMSLLTIIAAQLQRETILFQKKYQAINYNNDQLQLAAAGWDRV